MRTALYSCLTIQLSAIPFKDTSGPSLNILIKLMSMVSIVMAGSILVMLAAAGIITIGPVVLRQLNAIAKVYDDTLILYSNTHRHTPQHIA